VIEDLKIRDATVAILLADTTDYVIRRNVIGGGTSGINITETGAGNTGTIEDNLLGQIGGTGMHIEGMQGGAVIGNHVLGTVAEGIRMVGASACRVAENTLKDSSIGLSGTDGTKVTHNIVDGTPDPTLNALDIGGDDNYVMDNLVSASGRIGIRVAGDRNHLEGNIANANASWGLAFEGDDNVYRGNTARGNGGVAGTPVECSSPCSPDLCIYDTGTGNTSLGDNALPDVPCS
jgi:hypothetical protein